jgi:hypothetical protein
MADVESKANNLERARQGERVAQQAYEPPTLVKRGELSTVVAQSVTPQAPVL